MFTHILIPTDGSQRSEAAIEEGIKLAKDAHAKVTGFHVMPQFHVSTYKTELLEETKGHFAKEKPSARRRASESSGSSPSATMHGK